ncbi:rRNA-processing protein UTP23 homolog [Cimex lectularius]|uniref:rRNA-processing protein UTP23 homolog n=1 Tax=Cimex lectularius TaxID=79782 RepID=A0A8I6SAI3_CIMLE|nr:rRNA-processing protein UTP23 homolog [Cimex lectularius]
MRINRQKKVNKYINFYINNFGFRKPFQVLVDGTFCHVALKSKVNIKEQLPKYLGDVKLLTTPCCVVETEKLGPTVYGAMLILKQFSVHLCGHKTPMSASKCLLSMLGKENPNRYMIATQDRELQAKVKRVKAAPILFIFNKAPTLEEPSPYTQFLAKRQMNEICGLSEDERKVLNEFKEAVLGPQTPVFKKRRKKKGGPNPLSCKKKKKPLPQPKTNQKNKEE